MENWRFLFAAFQGAVEFETTGGAVEKYSWFHSGGAVILVPFGSKSVDQPIIDAKVHRGSSIKVHVGP